METERDLKVLKAHQRRNVLITKAENIKHLAESRSTM
jgi:hypothetical protein